MQGVVEMFRHAGGSTQLFILVVRKGDGISGLASLRTTLGSAGRGPGVFKVTNVYLLEVSPPVLFTGLRAEGCCRLRPIGLRLRATVTGLKVRGKDPGPGLLFPNEDPSRRPTFGPERRA